ncbi:MAG: DUF4280 domain-containing protein [Bacillota bacterium]
MDLYVGTLSIMKCTFGSFPAPLLVIPYNGVYGYKVLPMATINDHIPYFNILPFGMCMCPGNPMFIAATAAAAGVPTPVPCIPNTPFPWFPGEPRVRIGFAPALTYGSTLCCMWGGMIKFLLPVPFNVINLM